MQLTLTRESPTNSVYRDQDGRPLYRVETPPKSVGMTSMITRFVSNSSSSHDESITPARSDTESETDIHLMRLEEEEVAQILWRTFSGTSFKFGERTVLAGTYLARMDSLGW